MARIRVHLPLSMALTTEYTALGKRYLTSKVHLTPKKTHKDKVIAWHNDDLLGSTTPGMDKWRSKMAERKLEKGVVR